MRETYRLYSSDLTAATTSVSIDVRSDGILEECAWDLVFTDAAASGFAKLELSFASTPMTDTNDTRQVIHAWTLWADGTGSAQKDSGHRFPMIEVFAGERIYLHQTTEATPTTSNNNVFLVVNSKAGKGSAGRDSRGRYLRRES